MSVQEDADRLAQQLGGDPDAKHLAYALARQFPDRLTWEALRNIDVQEIADTRCIGRGRMNRLMTWLTTEPKEQ